MDNINKMDKPLARVTKKQRRHKLTTSGIKQGYHHTPGRHQKDRGIPHT